LTLAVKTDKETSAMFKKVIKTMEDEKMNVKTQSRLVVEYD